jgi:hypothetical protein
MMRDGPGTTPAFAAATIISSSAVLNRTFMVIQGNSVVRAQATFFNLFLMAFTFLLNLSTAHLS